MLFSILGGICSPLAGIAQKLTFDGGVVAGLYGSDLVGDKEKFWKDDYEKSGIIGVSVGPFVRCNFSPESFGTLEILYSSKGSNFGYINQYFTQSFEKIRFHYIEVPLLFGTHGAIQTLSGKINFSLETGLSYSKLFSSVLSYDKRTQRQEVVSLNGFREHDLSWTARMYVPYKVGGNYSILLGFHIERSLLSIHDNFKLYHFDYGFDLKYMFKNL